MAAEPFEGITPDWWLTPLQPLPKAKTKARIYFYWMGKAEREGWRGWTALIPDLRSIIADYLRYVPQFRYRSWFTADNNVEFGHCKLSRTEGLKICITDNFKEGDPYTRLWHLSIRAANHHKHLVIERWPLSITVCFGRIRRCYPSLRPETCIYVVPHAKHYSVTMDEHDEICIQKSKYTHRQRDTLFFDFKHTKPTARVSLFPLC